MRFGRSTRTLAAVGRRLLGDKPEGDFDGIASDERSALLNASAGDPAMEYTEVATPVPTGGDPTQRLLTALGRFQRQVNKAESGAPQHQWADDCMEQLIDGISIAHENNWHDVKEALTDTARILQSYEDAAVAQQAVPFLQDAYEILCLMVGDIIVDNVRSGVMTKWRQRYNLALNDLARHGVSLVDEDGEEPAVQPDNIVRFEQPAQVIERAFPFGDPDEDDAAEVIDEAEDQDESAPTLEVGDAQEDIDTDAAEAIVFEEEALEVAEADEEGEATAELDTEEEVEVELEDETEIEEVEDAEAEAEYAAADTEDAEEEAAATELPPLDEVLYAEPTPTPAPTNIHRLAASPQPAPAAEAIAELFDTPVQTPRVMEAAPAAVRDPDEDVQSLLRTAQQAMSRGDVANAKVMALQVAVKMAELEVSRAKDTLRVAEGRLEDTQRSIETASEAVRRTEAGVADVEEQIGQREAEFQQKRDHIAGLRDHMGTVQGVIEDIDEQIRVLQERRAAEERNITFLQDQLEQSLAAESRIQTDLDMLAQEEEAAREALDAAKQRVRDLQRERLGRESEINDSRHTLSHQERSVDDIQRTLQQVMTGGDEPAAESGLLF